MHKNKHLGKTFEYFRIHYTYLNIVFIATVKFHMHIHSCIKGQNLKKKGGGGGTLPWKMRQNTYIAILKVTLFHVITFALCLLKKKIEAGKEKKPKLVGEKYIFLMCTYYYHF